MFEEGDPKELLRGKVQAFLQDFEASEETEEDMKTLLPMWRDELLNGAHEVGGGTYTGVRTLMNVCEDYASGRGVLERVRQQAEEIRLQLDL